MAKIGLGTRIGKAFEHLSDIHHAGFRLMAHRRRRISVDQVEGFLTRLQALPIDVAPHSPVEVLRLPALALEHGLTNYDAAYLALSNQSQLPLATNDSGLRRAAAVSGVKIFAG